MSYERKDIPELIALFRSVNKAIESRESSSYFLCFALEKIECGARREAGVGHGDIEGIDPIAVILDDVGEHHRAALRRAGNGLTRE